MNIFKQIPSAKKYEIDVNSAIRAVSNKRPISKDGEGNVSIYNDEGDRVTLSAAALKKETWNGKTKGAEAVEGGDPKASKKELIVKKVAKAKTVVTKKAVSIQDDEPTKTEATNGSSSDKDTILALTCKKHQKLWLLHKLGLGNIEVAVLCGTNRGHLGNVVKDYNERPELVEKAEALLNK